MVIFVSSPCVWLPGGSGPPPLLKAAAAAQLAQLLPLASVKVKVKMPESRFKLLVVVPHVCSVPASSVPSPQSVCAAATAAAAPAAAAAAA
eukprot:CAMPEP_0206593646 /NCGR_PEP_ID=MMETSP0325_2-20121206/41797_1 /ASSEMBLY_ACC=CAM_ASM_000347 /TAXON_ID=2866 /ORGANISM="Crypthecodinium cohnii, Strain Seligo" /LENGTH=90 /DNA_ID=CAMNT_0054103745 /DNA_START=136 /DNA_END=406 /DNA_ORIENTATION=-